MNALPMPAVTLEPEILSRHAVDNGLRLDLVVPPALFYFDGHFPGYPVLPGVVQLHWAIGLGRRHLAVGAGAPRTVRVKFVRPITPGTRLVLSLAHDAATARLSFGYADGAGPFSSGQVGFR